MRGRDGQRGAPAPMPREGQVTGETERDKERDVEDGVANDAAIDPRRPGMGQVHEHAGMPLCKMEFERRQRDIENQRDDDGQECGHYDLAKRRSRKISSREKDTTNTASPLMA